MKFTTDAKTKSARRIVLVSLILLAQIEVFGQMPRQVNYTYNDSHYGETEISFVPIEHWRLVINQPGTNIYVFIQVHRWIPGLL